ncbi:hypothetical protein LINGRAHAP2_LOCUS708 [Linum grandiflorum]
MVRKIKMHQHRTKKLQREESTLATRNKMKHEFQLCCDKVGYPDLFISFTCNSNWPEIEHMVNLVRHTEGNDPCHGLMLISMLNSATNQEEVCYYSSNSIQFDSIDHSGLDAEYSPEFLNTLKIGNFPEHELKLKVGMPVILLRNIDQTAGLCNEVTLLIMVSEIGICETIYST